MASVPDGPPLNSATRTVARLSERPWPTEKHNPADTPHGRLVAELLLLHKLPLQLVHLTQLGPRGRQPLAGATLADKRDAVFLVLRSVYTNNSVKHRHPQSDPEVKEYTHNKRLGEEGQELPHIACGCFCGVPQALSESSTQGGRRNSPRHGRARLGVFSSAPNPLRNGRHGHETAQDRCGGFMGCGGPMGSWAVGRRHRALWQPPEITLGDGLVVNWFLNHARSSGWSMGGGPESARG